ncbi:alpha carbonic anhydrase 7-like isoform X2 [Salvia hispanica]|uniref:alpha carbonic anhydrase 7-like isoform X2 n=1 Tax=Salvia hispanica TaxID=49212 RepID=UPI0020092111|nr:alpha carbonic anhydrase 7-like isoform X2 [Salvia hispanica]
MGGLRSSSVHRFTAYLIGFSLLMAIHSENRDGEVDNEHEFSYLKNSSKGPEYWGSLKEEWKLCSIGNFQSPINITKKRVMLSSQIGKLRRNYRPALAVLRNRGHDIMVEWNRYAGSVHLTGNKYDLVQCHWHTPSEHTVGGRRYNMELHMVHRSSEGQFAVIAILYHLGRSDHFLNKVLESINNLTKGEEEIDLGDVDPWDIKFGSRKYYRYMGSLTSPPCTENVLWILLSKGFKDNARPLQPLNERMVLKYHPHSL